MSKNNKYICDRCGSEFEVSDYGTKEVARIEIACQWQHSAICNSEKNPYSLDLCNKCVRELEQFLKREFLYDSVDNRIKSQKEPDSEPNFKIGDVCIDPDGRLITIAEREYSQNAKVYYYYAKERPGFAYFEGNLSLGNPEPHNNPVSESRNLSQDTSNCDKQFDNILIDSLRDYNRLNIATQFATQLTGASYREIKDKDSKQYAADIAKAAFIMADALLAESDKVNRNEH